MQTYTHPSQTLMIIFPAVILEPLSRDVNVLIVKILFSALEHVVMVTETAYKQIDLHANKAVDSLEDRECLAQTLSVRVAVVHVTRDKPALIT